MSRVMVDAGGVYGFMAEGPALRKIILADGTHENLGNTRTYTALCYGGDGVLYGANKDEIGTINQTTGAFTPIRNVSSHIYSIVYKDIDEVWYITDDAMVLLRTDTGAITYVKQNF